MASCILRKPKKKQKYLIEIYLLTTSMAIVEMIRANVLMRFYELFLPIEKSKYDFIVH